MDRASTERPAVLAGRGVLPGGNTVKEHVSSTTKKLFAASSLAIGLAGFAVFGGLGQAVATPSPDTGTYDELVEVHEGGGVTSIADDDGIQADQVHNSTAWEPGLVSGH